MAKFVTFLLFCIFCWGLSAPVPVYMMLPLTVVRHDGVIVDPNRLRNELSRLKSVHTYGIMIDLWWGVIERNGPKNYDFNAYLQIAQMCSDTGLKMAIVASFHRCGGNVGDDCNIPLPSWVRDVGRDNPNIWYTDKSGTRNDEYISLGVDNERIFHGRTPVEIYHDLLAAMRNSFSGFLGNTVTTLEVGLGPAGEMRYPSYPLSKWDFPGVGEFQCYDSYMLHSLSESAKRYGKPQYGHPPNNSGQYKDLPHHIPFFNGGQDNFRTEYGEFFLKWYSDELMNHGRRILKSAADIFRGTNVQIAAKIAGIHWWYFTEAHAPELTAGYYHTRFRNGYDDISKMFAENNVEFQYTCLEMRNSDQHNCGCGPEDLVSLTRGSAWRNHIKYSGENALPTGSERGYSAIIGQSRANGRSITSFTYLRMFPWIFETDNFRRYSNFIQQMKNL